MKAIGILPTVIFEEDLPPQIYSALMNMIPSIDFDRDGYTEQYSGGAKAYHLTSEVMSTGFVEWAEQQMNEINKGIHGSYVEDMTITTCWINRYKQGEFNTLHRHPWSLFSGVVFLTGCNQEMQFVKEHSYHRQALKMTEDTNMAHPYPARDGSMVIFPSDLQHIITPNENDTIRYTIAFNALPSKVNRGFTVQFSNCHSIG